MAFKRITLVLAVLSIPFFGKAEDSFSFGSKWKGLHNADASILIDDNEAKALQNVDITDSQLGIKKRMGYALFNTIGVSTAGVRGGYYFTDVSGNKNLIHTNNGKVYKSVTGSTYSAFITTDTSGSYYDFTDSQGYLYRLDSNNDQFARYDGTTLTYYPSAPKGDQLEALPSIMAVSGATTTPNTVYFSAAGDFTNYATGILETDPFTEQFGLPGQKITALKYAFGNLYVFTRSTLSFWQGSSQYDGQIQDVSTTLGTYQPNSILFDLGQIYWQGQDKHFYSFDGNQIVKISSTLDISGFAGGESKTWTQDSGTDFTAGTQGQTSALITDGDVVLATASHLDTTTADFTAGSTSNTSIIGNSVYLSTNNTNVLNNSFETGSGLTPDNWTNPLGSPNGRTSSFCGVSAKDGSFAFRIGVGSTPVEYDLVILDASGVFISTAASWTNTDGGCVWQQISASLSSYVGRYIKLRITSSTNANNATVSDAFLCSGGTVSFWREYGTQGGNFSQWFDLVEGARSTTYSGTFTSASFDTTFESSATWKISTATIATNGNSVTLQTQSSSDGSSWEAATSWTSGTAPASTYDRYLRYIVTMSTGGTTNATALPHLDDVTLNAVASTGTFISQTKSIGASITSWNNFNKTDDTSSGGTITYAMRSASTEGGLSAASWTTVTDATQISISTNAWAQVRASISITTGTQNPAVKNFTVGWNEGTIVRTFGSVDSNHRLMWSVGEGASTVANVTYIFDPRFSTWLKYSFPMDAPAQVGTSIYFGNPNSGNVYVWPSGNNDNGSAITSYWQSKDFILGDPFLEKDMNKYSFIAKSQTGSNLDWSFNVDASTVSTTVNYSLTEPLSGSFRKINDLFPSGIFGSFINFKFGNDDLDSPFEVYVAGVKYTPRAWRVLQ